MHDARVFAHPSLYSKLSKGELLPHNKTTTYNGTDVPLFIIGNSAYPLENMVDEAIFTKCCCYITTKDV